MLPPGQPADASRGPVAERWSGGLRCCSGLLLAAGWRQNVAASERGGGRYCGLLGVRASSVTVASVGPRGASDWAALQCLSDESVKGKAV